MLFLTPNQQSSVEAVKALQYLSNQRQRIVTLNYCALYKTLTYLLCIIADHAEGRSSYPMGEVCVCVCVRAWHTLLLHYLAKYDSIVMTNNSHGLYKGVSEK